MGGESQFEQRLFAESKKRTVTALSFQEGSD
jgi:hypothetical protein